MTSLLEIRQLAKSYGDRRVVDSLSFSLEAGEVFGLLGPNGAGKSTTMMMICGILDADAGEVLFDGQPLQTHRPESRSQLGVVPQDLAIYPEMTAAENLNFFASLYGLKGQARADSVERALDQVGLTARANDHAGTFSGGMKRRLNFAAAVLHSPRLLILDEPTVGVDPQSRAHLLDCVRSLRATGTSVIYASHYMEEVEAICQRAAIIDHGNLLASDTIPALLSQIPQEVQVCVTSTLVAEQIALPSGSTIETRGDTSVIHITAKKDLADQGVPELASLLGQLRDHEIGVTAIRTLEPNLERLFLKLTGHRLRD